MCHKDMNILLEINKDKDIILKILLLGDGLCWVYNPPIHLYGKLSTFGLHLSVRATCKVRGDTDSKESGQSIKTKQSSNKLV